MRKARTASLVVALALAAGASARAATLATGLMFWNGGGVTTTCWVTNLGSKPATITSVTVQDHTDTDLAPFSENCTQGPLLPGDTCFWSGPEQFYGGGKVEFKGGAKFLRGRCVLRDGTTGDVVGSAAELR